MPRGIQNQDTHTSNAAMTTPRDARSRSIAQGLSPDLPSPVDLQRQRAPRQEHERRRAQVRDPAGQELRGRQRRAQGGTRRPRP
jgi:hypothetical protein